MKTAAKTPPAELLFRALADRTRLRILGLLLGGERCVCELVAALDLPQPTASRHLAYLRRAGLVLRRREAQWWHYRLAPAQGKLHEQLLACLGCCCRELPEESADRRRLGNWLKKCCAK
ncbi:MAG: helix-turn-helix transcriptional regulator [Planctomycetaceae bacterium]|nr:helix-turn-helix transcriptional regulator [Planctomycetaceae bacterium]